jgi:hypothetical protein
MKEYAQGSAASPAGRRIAWGLAVAITLANIAGYAFDLYARFWWFDRVLHAATIFTLTYWFAVFVLPRVLSGAGQQGLLLAGVVICAGVAVGAWWEVAEWGFDQVAPGNVIKGKYDTVFDVVMDTVGAALAAWMGLRALQPGATRGDGDRA